MDNPLPKRFDGQNYKASDVQNFLHHEGFKWRDVPASNRVEYYHFKHQDIVFALKRCTKPNGTKYIEGIEWEKALKNASLALKAAKDAATKPLPPAVQKDAPKPPSAEAGTFASRAHGYGATDPRKKLKATTVDLVIDNTLISNLMKVQNQEGKRAAVDILKQMAQLPNIRVIIPEKVVDECLSGKPNLQAKILLDQASHLVTNAQGETTETPRENTKIFIWHSPQGAKRLNHKEFKDHGGEQNIMDYCASPACTRPVIIVSDDNTFFYPLLQIHENAGVRKDICTAVGHSVGLIGTPGLLYAAQNTVTPDIDARALLDEINTRSRIKLLKVTKGKYHFRGLDKTDCRAGSLLEDVLQEGLNMQTPKKKEPVITGVRQNDASWSRA